MLTVLLNREVWRGSGNRRPVLGDLHRTIGCWRECISGRHCRSRRLSRKRFLLLLGRSLSRERFLLLSSSLLSRLRFPLLLSQNRLLFCLCVLLCFELRLLLGSKLGGPLRLQLRLLLGSKLCRLLRLLSDSKLRLAPRFLFGVGILLSGEKLRY